MICRKFLHISSVSFFLLTLLTQTSCEKFAGSQTIPAYIKIDSISLGTDYATQGTALNNIEDAWVYVDGTLIGTFQLPAKFPVLYQGVHELKVFAGVKKDGIATTRIAYPFYKGIVKTISLTADSTLNMGTLSTTYLSTAKFLWREDFDDVALTLDTTAATTAKIQLTPTDDKTLTLEGNHSGIVTLDTIGATFEAVSHSAFAIPNSAVFLEMNFNVNTPLEVGTQISISGALNQVPIVYLNNTNGQWKKIYIDLTTTLNAYAGATSFKVYFHLKNMSGSHYRVLMDNIKLLSF
jgi:hypothetical protein